VRISAVTLAFRAALAIVALGIPLANVLAAAPAQTAAELDDIDTKVCRMASSTEVNMETGLAEYLSKALILPNGDRLHFIVEHAGDDYLELTDKDGKDVYLSYPEYENDSDDVMQSNDQGIRLMSFMGRPYVLHYVGSQPLYLHQIDRVNAGRSITPICRFKPNVSVSLTQAEDHVDAPLCDRIEKRRLHVVHEEVVRNPKAIKGSFVVDSARIRVDFLNNGRPMTLIRSETTPTLGVIDCRSSLLTIAGKASAQERKLLDQLQDKSSAKPYVPGMLRAGCADEPARWLADGKKTYLEMRSIDYDGPVTEDSEYWFVSSVKNGRVHRICEAFYDRKPPILTSIWDGKTWVLGGADTFEHRFHASIADSLP
jgi:hypothetical protein